MALLWLSDNPTLDDAEAPPRRASPATDYYVWRAIRSVETAATARPADHGPKASKLGPSQDVRLGVKRCNNISQPTV